MFYLSALAAGLTPKNWVLKKLESSETKRAECLLIPDSKPLFLSKLNLTISETLPLIEC